MRRFPIKSGELATADPAEVVALRCATGSGILRRKGDLQVAWATAR